MNEQIEQNLKDIAQLARRKPIVERKRVAGQVFWRGCVLRSAFAGEDKQSVVQVTFHPPSGKAVS